MYLIRSKIFSFVIISFLSFSAGGNADSLHQRLGLLLDSVHLAEKKGDKNLLAGTLFRLGKEHYQHGDISFGLKYLEQSALLFSQLGEKEQVARIEQLLGNIQSSFRNFDSALKFYNSAFSYWKKTDNKRVISSLHNNLGLVYNEMGDSAKASYEFFTSLGIRMEIGDSILIGQTYNNIGTLRYTAGRYPEALDYFKKGLIYRRSLNTPITSQYESMINIGKTLIKLNRLAEAELILRQGYSGGQKENSLELSRRALAQLKEIYKISGRFAEAYKMQEEYYLITDSLFSEQKRQNSLKAGVQYEYIKKIQQDSLLREEEKRMALLEEQKEEALRAESTKRIWILIGSLSLILIMVGVIAFILHRGNKEKKKVNELITAQRDQLEQKQKEIQDSIRYAKRIQDALLPSQQEIKNVFPDSFIYYRPKDIISGDFYWAETIGGKTWIALADCTGHGVPGAMMSMLGISFLNETLREKGDVGPARMLDELHRKVVSSLNRDITQRELMDGMDLALLCIDRERNMLIFSLACRPLLVLSKGEKKLIKGERDSIGGIKETESSPFRQLMISVKPGDSIYLYSDGFADQFGGPSGKKYKSKMLEEFLLEGSKFPKSEQARMLTKEFESWKGGLEQVDDVTVLGITI